MKPQTNREDTNRLAAEVTEQEELKEPSLYQVVLHNDDYTPKEFVVGLLEKFFYMGRRKATEVMQEAHTEGKAGCGWFAKDFAEAKAAQVMDYAKIHEHPLAASLEVAR